MELDSHDGFYFLKDDIYIANAIRSGKGWETWLPPIVQHFYKPGTDVLDCGAHVGCHSVAFSKFATVHAFEPVFHEVLAMNTKDRPVTVHPYGLSDEERTTEIYFQKVENGTATNYGGTSLEFKSDSSTTCNLKVFDQLAYNGTPSVVKMDVEGHELRALKGMTKTLMRHKPAIIIEILEGQENVKDYLNLLGYIMVQVLPERNFLYLANLNFS